MFYPMQFFASYNGSQAVTVWMYDHIGLKYCKQAIELTQGEEPRG